MNIVEILKLNNKTVATMESCTGGGLANYITNIPGASEVFYYGAVTYSNEYKIKMGVSEEIIEKYSVYSVEVAKEMSKAISIFTNSDYGIGITGKLNAVDKSNLFGKDDLVYISVYDKSKDLYLTNSLTIENSSREEMKLVVIKLAIELLKKLI